MKVRKRLKRGTQIIIVSVLILTLISLRVTYSAFFSVQTETNIQEISTGTLNVTATSTAMSSIDVLPTTETLPTEPKSTLKNENSNNASLTIKNSGTIDANFKVSISYDSANVPSNYSSIDFKYLIIGIFDVDNKSWLNINPNTNGVAMYNISVDQLTSDGTNSYLVFNNTISKAKGSTPTTKNYKVYIWVANNTLASEIGKAVYLKLDVVSTPINGQAS